MIKMDGHGEGCYFPENKNGRSMPRPSVDLLFD